MDTSYILALVNTQDEFHSQAKALADQINSDMITTEAVLVEIGNALASVKWRRLAINILNDLRTDEHIEIISVNSNIFSKALQLYASRMDKVWGVTDCISFVAMKDKELREALTTDRHFTQAGFQALLRIPDA